MSEEDDDEDGRQEGRLNVLDGKVIGRCVGGSAESGTNRAL